MMKPRPKWWDTNITIYNKYETAEGEVTWYRTHISNCFWKYVRDKMTAGQTVIETNSTICRIPEDTRYLPKFEWKELADKSNNFTLGVQDIIVVGMVEDVIDEYTSGKRSSDLIKKYKEINGCMIIDNVSINTGLGRGMKHYLVKGI